MTKPEEKIKELCQCLAVIQGDYMDSLEALKELKDHEWITTEMFNRLVANSLLGALNEIDQVTTFIKGYN